MKEVLEIDTPTALENIENDTIKCGFAMASDFNAGALLRSLCAAKPAGKLLELGTGTGLATCWMLDGMDNNATLKTVDNDENVLAVARKHLAHDPRIDIVLAEGRDVIQNSEKSSFDLIFADAWDGKYSYFEEAIELLRPGGIYMIDDMIPTPSWPDGHRDKANALIDTLEKNQHLNKVGMHWSSGLVIAVKK